MEYPYHLGYSKGGIFQERNQAWKSGIFMLADVAAWMFFFQQDFLAINSLSLDAKIIEKDLS